MKSLSLDDFGMPDSVPSTTADFSLPELSSLDAEQAAAILEQGKDAVVFALLTLAKQLADCESPDVNPATP